MTLESSTKMKLKFLRKKQREEKIEKESGVREKDLSSTSA